MTSVIRLLVLAVLSAAFIPAQAGTDTPVATNGMVRMESRAWPEPSPCNACVAIQFGRLAMQFRTTEVSKFLIANSDASALHIHVTAPDGRMQAAGFVSQRNDRFAPYVSSGFFSQLGITSHRDFFEAIGRVPDSRQSPLAVMRKTEGLGMSMSLIVPRLGGNAELQ